MTGIKWVLAVTTFLTMGTLASANNFCETPNPNYKEDSHSKTLGDWLPWPFGSECLTPWRKLEGTWIRPQDDQVGKIDFDVSLMFDGNRFLTVKRFDKSGSMVDEGAAEVQSSDKIISVKMNSVDPVKPAYMLFIRHYPEKGSCEDGFLATVITIRKQPNRCEDDVNYILKKAQKGEG